MKIFRFPRSMQAAALVWRRKGLRVGFVPTMGALHEGHLSLVRRARRENDIVVVSIFVNPAQFGPHEDYLRYPRPFAKDKALCRAAGADALFAPAPARMYPAGYDTWVQTEKLSQPLCGAFRPGHFRGVATVVTKLFNIVQPMRAYFGVKDYQQLKIIERMTKDLNMPVRVVGCPIVREKDGLAKSSRNAYLSDAERAAARLVPLALRSAGEVLKSGQKNASAREAGLKTLRKIPGFKLDYFAVADPETLGPLPPKAKKALLAAALWVGKTRLIDNRLVTRK